jgi:hypothetical protein
VSIHRTIQTGLLIGNNLQTAALRSQVAQMQQLAETQQQREDQLGAMRQIVFESHQLLDTAEHHLPHNPVHAVFATRIASLHLMRPDARDLPSLEDKQALYQNQRRAAELLCRGETLLPTETAQGLHRLAWLQQVRMPLVTFATWLKIAEMVQRAAILFTPSAGIFRGVMIFIAGNVIGSFFVGIFFEISHVLGLLVYLSFNGITLLITDTIARQKLLVKCNTMATQVGGSVSSKMRPATARQLVEQCREALGSWGYKSMATTSGQADDELAKVDAEIEQLHRNFSVLEDSRSL